jgi:hypothetical protein
VESEKQRFHHLTPGIMTKAVAFLVFNRPHTTERVFEAIRQARPKQLLVVADGPRSDRPDDVEKCAAVRKIVEKVDWPCEVKRNYAETNMGCKRRVSSGLDWVFSEVEEAIILEDDCLPTPSFFPFCEELLERYRHDTRIMHISGDNFQNGISRTLYTYYFSHFAHIWGWATWRRAWKHYDLEMKMWSKVKMLGFQQYMFDSVSESEYWRQIFDAASNGKIDTWDYAWNFTCFVNGLSICPNVNLVSNIGFADDGTHCSAGSPLANLPVFDTGKITHPLFVIRHREADEYTFEHIYKPPLPRFAARYRNKYFFGSLLRKAPLIGSAWAGLRNRRQ